MVVFRLFAISLGIQSLRRFDFTAAVLIFAVILLLSFVESGMAQNVVEGSLTVDGTTVPIKHGYVDQYREEFTLILTDNPVEPDMVPDGIHGLSEQEKVRALEFTVSRETRGLLPRMRKAIYFHPVWDRHIDIGHGVLTITEFDEDQLVGSIKTSSEQETDGHQVSYNISFAIGLKKAPLTVTFSGKSDPPSQAYAAYSQAVAKADVEAFKKYVPSKNLQSLPNDEKELVLGLEFVQDTMMTNIEILSSTITGEKAVLTMKGNRGLATADGTVTMILEDGSWKVSQESWKTGTANE